MAKKTFKADEKTAATDVSKALTEEKKEAKSKEVISFRPTAEELKMIDALRVLSVSGGYFIKTTDILHNALNEYRVNHAEEVEEGLKKL